MINKIKNFLGFQVPDEHENFILDNVVFKPEYDVRNDNDSFPETVFVSGNYDNDLKYIKKRFDYPKNSDIVIREIVLGKKERVFLLMIDGMVDNQLIDIGIIKPMLEFPELLEIDIKNIADTLEYKILSHSQVMRTKKMQDVIDGVNFGTVGIFMEGSCEAFSLDVRNWGHRSIDKPENEQSIYGPQEAFAEMLRNNTALIRKSLKTEKLICEEIEVGTVSKTKGVLMYISDIANNELVDEVRRRIKSISMEYVISIEEVSLFIEENAFMLTNQILSTERPDRTSRALADGRVVFVMNGNPHALIMPTNAFELTHAAPDAYMRVPYANMMRVVRLIAMFLSVLLPGLYLAITLFHQEMLPTALLYSISASRENVPFPSLAEMLLMEVSFEMIREAGIRMPGPIGSTLGIVGGLILGQAAVSAKIVSPIMIIIIAVTGIGSFATSDYTLGWTYRILRIIFVLLASLLGFYGISIGIFLYATFIASCKSFGIPFMSPITHKGKNGILSSVFVSPIFTRQKRPYFLNTKRVDNEQKISRKWKMNKRK
jgi:spore germination protein KA